MNIRNMAALGVTVLGIALAGIAEAAQTPNFYNCSGKNVSLTLAVGSKAEVGILPPETLLT